MISRISEQTKKRLIESFFELLETESYEDLTILDITEQAGMSRRTFYRFFKNKEDLLDQYLDGIIAKWLGYAKDHQAEIAQSLIKEILNFWQQFIPELTVLVKANLSFIVLDKFNKYLPDQLMSFFKQNKPELPWIEGINDESSYIYLFRLSIGALWNVFSQWLIDPKRSSIEELTQFIKIGFLRMSK